MRLYAGRLRRARPSTATIRSRSPRRFADAGAPLDPRRRPRRGPHRRAGEPSGRGGDRRRGGRAGRACRPVAACAGRRRRAALADAGVARVVMGTRRGRATRSWSRRIAARQPVAVGLDGRGGEVAVHGWAEGAARRVLDVLARLRGRRRRRGRRHRDRPRRHAGRARPRRPAPRRSARTDRAGDRVGRGRRRSTTSRPWPLEVDGRRLAGVIAGKALYEGRFTVATDCRAGRVLRR